MRLPPVNQANPIVILSPKLCSLQTFRLTSCHRNVDCCEDAYNCNISCIDPNPAVVPPERCWFSCGKQS